MTKEMMIKVLEEDRCTRREAEDHIKRGTIIWEEDDADEFLRLWNEVDGGEDPITLEDVKNWDVVDVHYVTVDGNGYIIEYVL